MIQDNYHPFSDEDIIHETRQVEINTIDSHIERGFSEDMHAEREAEAYRENYLRNLKDRAKAGEFRLEIKGNRFIKITPNHQ